MPRSLAPAVSLGSEISVNSLAEVGCYSADILQIGAAPKNREVRRMNKWLNALALTRAGRGGIGCRTGTRVRLVTVDRKQGYAVRDFHPVMVKTLLSIGCRITVPQSSLKGSRGGPGSRKLLTLRFFLGLIA